MGVRNYLVEGVSGSGKTSVAEELARRGEHVVHGDRVLAYPGDPWTGARLEAPAEGSVADRVLWRHAHHVWDEAMVRSIARDGRWARSFFCGGSRNFHRFRDVFDGVFALDVDVVTLKRRVAGRGADEFGGTPEEWALVSRLHSTGEDMPRGAVRIDATAPLGEVVDTILATCREIEAT